VWDESELLERLDLSTSDGGISYVHRPSGCEIAVVMTSQAQVETYAGTGDTVAATPDRSAGVKITDAETATCLEQLTAALEEL